MIVTNRKITIGIDKSVIDEPVVLYRGDYEVEIRFTLDDSKFKFLSGVNVIESDKPSYAQLAILRPDADNIFSDITKCSEGIVSFVLTKTMIDQINEVGAYSFHIRMFDYNKTSRITIPPVEFGIEVREPIASEDRTNNVNSAYVGYSISKAASIYDEPVGPTFDSNGNYNKTNWKNGDRITDDKLNKIEQAIDTINQNEIDDVNNLEKRINSNFNILNSTKMEYTDKIKSSQLDTSSDNNKIKLINLSDEVRSAMTGNTQVSPIIADGSITTEKYAPKSVTDSVIADSVLIASTNHISSISNTGAYDVFEKCTNAITEHSFGTIKLNSDMYEISPGGYKQYFIEMGGDLTTNKPFSIKIPVTSISDKAEIITRYKTSSSTSDVKNKLTVCNNVAVISNVVYPADTTIIEILLDNRRGTNKLIYGTPSLITSGLPIIDNGLTIEDINESFDIKNYITGGDSSLTVSEMKTIRTANCIEVRCNESYTSVEKGVGISIQNDSTNGYLFYYYTPTDGLEPGKIISASIDIINDSASATVELKFLDSSGSVIGQTKTLYRRNNKFVINNIKIPSSAAKIVYRIDNRNSNGSRLTINNIKLVNGNKTEGIVFPESFNDLSLKYIKVNLFPNPDCDTTEWINYTQSTPTYELVEDGVKFINKGTSTKCIGFDTSISFKPGDDLPYNISISDFYNGDSNGEFDFNIIFYNGSNEISRVTKKINRIGDYSGTVNIPENTNLIRLRFDLGGTDNYYIINKVYLGGEKMLLSNISNNVNGDNSGKILYVSPNGDDGNSGEINTPKATVNAALMSGATDIRLFGGEYSQTINLSMSSSNTISISRYELDKEVTFLNPNRILCNSETKVSGYNKVYKSDIKVTIATNNTWIFQDNIPDESTLITDEERHPLQRGYKYRCYDTKIRKCSATTLTNALTEIDSSSDYRWFIDGSTLYYSRPSTVNDVNPICYSDGTRLLSNTKYKELKISGINSKYMHFAITGSINSEIADCKSVNVYGAGAFSYNSALNCKFIRCEAARAHHGSNGDGFNGHCNNTGDIYSKQLTATFLDCWSHDNNDDGYSDHERAETTIMGGLYEYNCKGGVTPSYGSHVTCYNTYSRQNYCGFNYVGTAVAEEGGMYGQLICYNCVAENNNRGGEKAGFNINGTKNSMMLIDCKSIGHNTGYKASNSDNIVTLIDCGSKNNTTTKGGNGKFIINNTTVVS